MLNRRKRGKILVKCLKDLYSMCARRKNLFSDKDTDDLVEEIGVHIWIALIRYRKKPYKQASKLAYRVGVNQLTTIVRAKLTVSKRGAGIKHVSTSSAELSTDNSMWLNSKSIYSNGVQIIDTLEAIASAAIRRVGIRKSSALMKALLYDWTRSPSGDDQILIMQMLKRDRVGMRKLVKHFIADIHKQMPSGQFVSQDNMLEKVEGRWRSMGKER